LHAGSPGTWRADLCADEGIPCVLGQALYLRASHGGNAKNDRLESHKIAALLRGGLMPQAYVYPRRMRATRALLRRRNHLMHQRAEVSAHLQHTGSPYTRSDPLGRLAKSQHRRGLLARFAHACVQQTIAVDVALVDGDDPLRAALERDSAKTPHSHDPVSLARLRTIPGVGTILALVRRYESEESARFPRVQAFVAYARLVKSARESQGKRQGTSGKKIGNAHRQGAFSAAAGLFLKHHKPAQQYLATLAPQHGTGKALSSLAHTLGRAVSCMLTHQIACDQAKFLAPEGCRERTNLGPNWRHWGRRHTPVASHRASMLVGHEPAPAVPVPNSTSGLLWR
jgi:transposase